MLQVVTVWRHIPSKIPKMIWREKEKGHMGTIFGPLLTHFGQIMTETNVEMLILKMPMLNHDTHERNVLCHPKILWHSGVISKFVKGIFFNFVKFDYFLPKQLCSTSSPFSPFWWIFYF